jgi:hypothetical protein
MGYSLDLGAISLAQYAQLLAKQTLLPGRRMLQEQLPERFALLAGAGIKTVSELSIALSTPQRLASLSASTGICEEYLTLLRRELGSLTQKPVPLADFPAVDPALIGSLAVSGIRSSKAFWEQAGDSSSALFCLCDLVRINGVGAVAARAFYEAGYSSVAAVAQANAGEMLSRVSAVNAEKQYYRANLGEKDMQFCIDFATLLVEFSSR